MTDTAPAAAAPLLPRVPAAFFGMILGLGGLANGWRVATRVWGMPAVVGHGLALVAFVVWATLVVLFVAKWAKASPAARGELLHPVMGGFVALAPISTMIAGIAIQPLAAPLAAVMLVVGIVGQIAFGVWFVGRLWQGGRGAEATTPVLYLPTVGGSFVAAMALAALGVKDAAMMAFGAGFLTWIVIEAVMWQRLLHMPVLPVPIRATLGIHMAPPAVGLVAYLAASTGGPDALGLMLFGYALMQALIMARLVPWLTEQPFAAPYWAYSFAISALPTGALRLIERGETGVVTLIAPVLFVAANALIGIFAYGTVRLLIQGKLVPPPMPAPQPTPPTA